MASALRLGAMRVSMAAARPAAQLLKRRLSDDAPKRIRDLQKKFQQNPAVGFDNPTYLKNGKSDLACCAFLGSLGLWALSQCISGIYHMRKGDTKMDVV